jgi:peroxiredoxin
VVLTGERRSYREFRDRYHFPFPLVDSDKKVVANSMAACNNRTVYLIGPDGLIRYAGAVCRAGEVLAAVDNRQTAS